MLENEDARPILGAGLNQAQGLRDALCYSLGGLALPELDPDGIPDWLRDQGFDCPPERAYEEHPVSVILRAVSGYRSQSLGTIKDYYTALVSTFKLNPESKAHGLARGGGGWREGAAFCITSGFVRLLGASEQFELDVLKALMYYRPTGAPLGQKDDQVLQRVEKDVWKENPKRDGDVDYFEKPAIWTWMRGPAEGNDERRKIFKRAFGLDLTPGKDDADSNTNKKNRKIWYEKRNKIAHGREAVQMTLREYMDVDVYVTESMLHLSKQCQEKLYIII